MVKSHQSSRQNLADLRDDLANVSAELVVLMSAVTGDTFDLDKKAAHGIILVLERQLSRIDKAISVLSKLSFDEQDSS